MPGGIHALERTVRVVLTGYRGSAEMRAGDDVSNPLSLHDRERAQAHFDGGGAVIDSGNNVIMEIQLRIVFHFLRQRMAG